MCKNPRFIIGTAICLGIDGLRDGVLIDILDKIPIASLGKGACGIILWILAVI